MTPNVGATPEANPGATREANPKATRIKPVGIKPVLFVTGHAPAYRIGAFQCLNELEQVEFALFGGRLKHGGGGSAPRLPFPHRHVREHELYAMAASGRFRAVVCSTGGRVAPLATWAGTRRARVPLILWASLWAHPRSAAHAFSYPALRRLYRTADAVVTYGPHVSAYVQARGAQRVYVAPQAVDNSFWSSPDVNTPKDLAWPIDAHVKFLFAGRPAREKGLGVLVEAWSMSGLQTPTAALVLVGTGSTPPWVSAGGAVGASTPSASTGQTGSAPTPSASASAAGSASRSLWTSVGGADGASPMGASDMASQVISLDAVSPVRLRNFYAGADVLVVPSISTRTFREPWGLVVNEAMNRGLPVIASDAVGAAAGGLLRDGHNGIVVPAGDPIALAGAIRRLAGDASLRARMGAAAQADISAYTYDAWARGFSDALAELSLSGGR